MAGVAGIKPPPSAFNIGFDSEADRSPERNSNHSEDIVGGSGGGIMKNRFRTEAPKYRGLENCGPLESKTFAPASKSLRNANDRIPPKMGKMSAKSWRREYALEIRWRREWDPHGSIH